MPVDIIQFKAIEVVTLFSTGFVGFANDEHDFWMQPEETKDGFSTKPGEMWLERDGQSYGGHDKDYPWSVFLKRDRFEIDLHQVPHMECRRIIAEFEITDDAFADLRRLLQSLMIERRGALQFEE